MYPITNLYKSKIKEDGRDFSCNITIEHSNGTLELTDEDISQGSLIYTESSQNGDEFTIGSTVASDISLSILKKPEYEDVQFMGATLFVTIGLFVQESVDAHFLQPSQPSKMKGFEDKREYVPLGRFNIDDVNIQSSTIQLKAMDNLINLDIPYSLSKLSYPANLYQIYTNICSVGDISVGTLNFPNKDYVVQNRPDGELTFRDVLGYVAELSGTFAKCDRTGRLELKWYEPTDLVIEPEIRYSFTPSDDVVQIKGIMASTEDTTYLTGAEDYAIDLSENPLLQGDYETVLPIILTNVEGVIFTPYESEIKGNPAIQSGDMIVQVDKNGKEYNTIVTKMVYKYRGRSSLEAKGLPDISKGYKGSTNRKLAEIRRRIDVEVGDKITDLEQAQLNATEMIANTLGGYSTREEDAFYIHDAIELENSTKIWKWGLGGFGYSDDGGLTYTTGITAEGSIVANLVTAGIVTADMIVAGTLQSQDGGSWINLQDGSFNFKDAVKWIDGVFTINSPKLDALEGRMDTAELKITPSAITSTVESNTTVLATKSALSGVSSTANSALSSASTATQTANAVNLNFTQLKTFAGGQQLSGGNTTINANGVTVTHTGVGDQWSQLRADGFVRKWQYGDSKYLSDIYIVDGETIGHGSSSIPVISVVLPISFRGRTLQTFVVAKDITFPNMDTSIEQISLIFETQGYDTSIYGTPYVNVRAEMIQFLGGASRYHRGQKFTLIVLSQ